MNYKNLFHFLTLIILLPSCSDNHANWQNLLDYSTLQPPPPSINIFEPSNGKKIIYMAVEHVSNLDHPIIKKIQSIIESEKPTFCILEGFNPEDGISPKRILEIADKYLPEVKCPENVYAAYLCAKNNVPFVGGDIHNSKYLRELAKYGFTEKDVVFWMLAQNFPFWNREKIVNNENFEKLANDMIQRNITFWLNKQVLNYTAREFLKWHKEHIGKSLDVINDFPWDYDRKEFMPSLSKDATIYQRIQAHIMPLRDFHIVKMICEYTNKYDTILVIFGASHYEWQKKALEKLFKKPIKSYNIGS